MSYTPEPADVADEGDFRDTVVKEIHGILESAGIRHEVLRSFGLDVAVFISRAGVTECKLLETKTASLTKGRVGFGGKGEGIQVDFLRMEDEVLNGLGSSVRWLLANNLRRSGEKRYVLFDSSEARAAASGGLVSREKHNNFNVSILMRNAISWNELSRELESFLVRNC